MDGTSTLGKRRPSLNQLDNDPTAKRIGQQLRADLDLQQDLLRSMTTYRRALEAVAEASESVAQVIGRLQINTLTAHSALKEVRQQLDMPPVEAAAADKHKQLSLALQQMVKFHTMQTNQQLELANAIVYEFDRPLQLNMDSMRPALANWEKEYAAEMKSYMQALSDKEAESTRLGRKNVPMPRLQEVLREISALVAHVDTARKERFIHALDLERRQQTVMAHHLQKVLKAEVLCYKNVFYQDNGRGESSSSSSRRKKSEAKGSRDNSSHNVQPEAQRNLSHGDHHMADYDGSALPARIAPSASDHNGWNTGSHGHVSDRQHHHVGGRHAVDGHGNARKPVAPQHPHRKTIVAPKGTDLDQLANTISENFGDVDEYGFRIAGQHGRSPSSADRGKHTWRQTVREPVKLTTPVAQRSRDAADQQQKQPLALVLYDYIAEAEDDLPVLAGDIVRVIAVEGEWMYGMLLCASTQDVEESVFEYVPALVDGGHCLGWIPVSFTDNLGTGGDHGSGPAMF